MYCVSWHNPHSQASYESQWPFSRWEQWDTMMSWTRLYRWKRLSPVSNPGLCDPKGHILSLTPDCFPMNWNKYLKSDHGHGDTRGTSWVMLGSLYNLPFWRSFFVGPLHQNHDLIWYPYPQGQHFSKGSPTLSPPLLLTGLGELSGPPQAQHSNP